MGQRQSLAESRPIPGNSRWCSAWLNPREDGGVLSYTSGAASGSGVIWDPSSIPGQLDVLRVPGQIKILFIPSQAMILFIPGQAMILFIPGGVPLLTPASVGRRALGRPIHACWAIATAFARLPSWSASPGRWRLLGQAGIAYLQYCRWLGLAI